MGYGDENDAERGLIGEERVANDWEKEVRHGFIKKVFGILTVQLIITTAIGAVFVLVEPVKLFVQSNQWTVFVALILSFVLICVVSCCQSARRTHPYNLLILLAFTLVISYLVGTISAYYKAEYVLAALGITAVITIGLTIYASQTKYDFTMCGGVLFGILIALVVASFLGVFLFQNRIYYAIIGGVGAALFSAYLVYDVQLVMGGKRYEISPDEYVFGALSLYLDIINIFLYILQLLNGGR